MEDEEIEVMYRKPETILIVRRNPNNTYVIKRENGDIEIVTAKYIRENYETRWTDWSYSLTMFHMDANGIALATDSGNYLILCMSALEILIYLYQRLYVVH